MHVAEIDCELRSQRTGHQLRERQALLVVRFRDPLALLHQIPMHVADERDRAAEPDRSELGHVLHHLPKRVTRSCCCCFARIHPAPLSVSSGKSLTVAGSVSSPCLFLLREPPPPVSDFL